MFSLGADDRGGMGGYELNALESVVTLSDYYGGGLFGGLCSGLVVI